MYTCTSARRSPCAWRGARWHPSVPIAAEGPSCCYCPCCCHTHRLRENAHLPHLLAPGGVVHNRDSPEGCPCSRSRSNIQVLCVSQLLKHTAERICRSWSTTGTHVWNIFDDKCELIKGQWLNKYMLQPLKLLPSLRERRSRRKPALSHPTALLWAVATLLCLPLYNLPLLDRGQPDPSSILVSASKSMQWLQPSESPWALTASWSAPFPQADH